MAGPNYALVPNDWIHLEEIINDLSSRVLTSPIDTSTIVSVLSALSAIDVTAISDMASANSDALSAISDDVSAISNSLSAVSNLTSDAYSLASNALSVANAGGGGGGTDGEFHVVMCAVDAGVAF